MKYTWKDVFSLRKEIFGVATIAILLFHLNIYVPSPQPFALFLSKGNIGVDVFLMLSGLGLYNSIRKNTLSQFYQHRFLRVFLPYLLGGLVYFIWYDFFYLKDGFVQFILNLSTLNYWKTGVHPVWYVALLLILYAVYPILYQLDRRTHHVSSALIAVCVICGLTYLDSQGHLRKSFHCLSRVPVFMLGVALAEYLNRAARDRKEIRKWHLLICIPLVLVPFLSLPRIITSQMIYQYLVATLPFIILVGFLLVVFPVFNRVLAWLGQYSLEIYAVQMFLICFIEREQGFEAFPSYLWYVILPVVSILLSVVLSEVANLLSRRGENFLQKERKKSP